MIDVHQHMLPPDYRRWLTRGGEVHDGFPVPQWSVESALEAMERLGIDLAYLSISSPGIVDASVADAPSLARDVNAFGSAVTEAHPDRLRYFAALPMADPDRATAEAAHALDNLKASGVGLLANTKGIYLGDPSQQGLFEVLDARRAVVFVHPTTLPGGPAQGIPPFAADFLLDTTRAVIRLIASGTLANYPNIRFILPHAGGFVPYAATRIARTTASEGRDWPDVMAMLKSFYFDLAMSATATVLPSLLALVGPDKVCIGSDYPYAPAEAIAANFAAFAAYPLDDADRAMITRGTATALFSRDR
ncbi:MAG: amidohydrolase family protein [Pseudomonadota bacterium]